MSLYHVTTIPNLKVLEPHVSTHGKAYVYATTNLEFALFFGGNESAGDFDGMYGINNGVPFFYEAYSGALKRRFYGATCYIYEVDPSTFMEGKTSFKSEVVSEKPVKILGCEKVDNLYNYLMELNKNSKINLHFFEETKEYEEMIENHITDRIIRFGILGKKNSGTYRFCKNHFPLILEKLEEKSNTF